MFCFISASLLDIHLDFFNITFVRNTQIFKGKSLDENTNGLAVAIKIFMHTFSSLE